ncbi:MAG: hypothetical protein HY706_09995 [Candidatus Hydrogenedentes bacterium]|nr:hypothetical protein [Candidatus Hydrogenedentota bacterium]
MKKVTMGFLTGGLCLTVLLICGSAQAAIPLLLHHQGVMKSNGTLVSGTGNFRFALVNPASNVNLWTNDGSNVGTQNMPTAAVSLSINNGLYEVTLGASALMTPIPSSVFDADNVALRIWFDDGVSGPELLVPDQPVTTAPFSIRAVNADTAKDSDAVGGSSLADINAQIADDVATHAAIANAHHSKTIDASELIQGTLDNARLSAGVSLLGQTIELNSAEVTGQISDANVPAAIARDTEVTSAIDTHRTDPAAHTTLTSLVIAGSQITSGKIDNARLNTGPGNGLDADTVDGLQAGAFILTTGGTISASSTTQVLSVTNIGTKNALYAHATGASGYGIEAEANGTSGRGIYGRATDTGAGTLNWGGYFVAAGGNGQGVRGEVGGASATGVYGWAGGGAGKAIEGLANATGAVTNYGGYFLARGDNGRAVYGNTTGLNGKTADFVADGSGNAVGVQGYASYTGAVTNHGGYFTAAGQTGRGVYAQATSTATTTNYGGYFVANGILGIGVYGTGAMGIKGESTGNSLSGVYGVAGGDNADGVHGFGMGPGGDGVSGLSSESYAHLLQLVLDLG